MRQGAIRKRGFTTPIRETKTSIGVGRIANGLSAGLAGRRQLSLFEELNEDSLASLQRSDEVLYIDRRGKDISLTNDEHLLVKALSARIPFGEENIKNYINELVDTPQDEKGKYITRNISLPFSIAELSKTIIGDTKEASIKKIGERLIRLAEVEQAIPYYINGKKLLLSRPLIKLEEKIYDCYSTIRSAKGKRKPTTGTTEEERILLAANVVFTPIFLHEASNKYCPIYEDRYFKIARSNKTEIFLNVLSDLESKWRQYYINYQKSKHKAEALVYKNSTATIRDSLKTDYTSSRKRRSDFIPDLQRAINSLIEYGIITDKSHITKDNTNVVFYYNPDFVKNTPEDLLLTDE